MHVPLVFFFLLQKHTVNMYFSILFLMIVFLLMLKCKYQKHLYL